MQEEGYIAKILFPEGTKGIELGKTVAILVENEEDIAAFENYVDEGEEAASATPSAEPEPEPQAA